MNRSFADDRSKIWNNLLSSQVALFSESETQYLAHLPTWQVAKRVADIGCGNGEYIAQVARAFPDKSYVGFDTSKELISIAKKNCSDKGITFHCTDIRDVIPMPLFDCAILRFVVQHLESPLEFFSSLENLIKPNGLTVVIEPNFEESFAVPRLPGFEQLILAYEAMADEVGSSRAILRQKNGVQKLTGNRWHVSNVSKIHSAHDRESWNKTAIARILSGWINIIEASQCLTWDYSDLKNEVETWLSYHGRQLEIVLNVTTLRLTNE